MMVLRVLDIIKHGVSGTGGMWFGVFWSLV